MVSGPSVGSVGNWEAAGSVRLALNHPLAAGLSVSLTSTVSVTTNETGSLGAVLDSILEDGCNVKVYCAWSLTDSYEWNSGYTLKFGLHYINFSEPERTRVPKASARYYKKVLQTRTIDHNYEPVINLKIEL